MAEQRDEFGVPEGLAEGLRAAYRGSGGVEEKVDRAVIGAFGRRRAMRWWWGGAVAAGVAVVIGGGVWWQMEVRERGVAVAAAEGAGGGYVRTGDIRDAYFVARELAAGDRKAVAGWDQNGDGVVDQTDVTALAMAAVRLPEMNGGVR